MRGQWAVGKEETGLTAQGETTPKAKDSLAGHARCLHQTSARSQVMFMERQCLCVVHEEYGHYTRKGGHIYAHHREDR